MSNGDCFGTAWVLYCTLKPDLTYVFYHDDLDARLAQIGDDRDGTGTALIHLPYSYLGWIVGSSYNRAYLSRDLSTQLEALNGVMFGWGDPGENKVL